MHMTHLTFRLLPAPRLVSIHLHKAIGYRSVHCAGIDDPIYARNLLLRYVNYSDRRQQNDQSWFNLLCNGPNEVSTLNEITKAKERIGEALARVDAQREKLTSQLSELEATERVLARYGQGARATKMGAVKGSTAARQAPAPSRTAGFCVAFAEGAAGFRAPL